MAGAGADEGIVVDRARSQAVLGLGYSISVRFAELLAREGELRGLIGPRELPRLWSRHIVNSAAVAAFLPRHGLVADVGSGAGLPGVVLASMRPDLEFVLVEPMERRAAWLTEVVGTLSLPNVVVQQAQAQELHGTMEADAVVARAVASLDKLITWTWPLVVRGGRLLAQKGARAQDELAAAERVLRRLKVETAVVHDVDLLGDGDVTRVVELVRG